MHAVKKILAVLLAVVLLSTAVPVGVLAAEPESAASTDAVLLAEGDGDTEEPVELPEIDIFNYKKRLIVPVGSRLFFHTTANAPEGYEIVWSTGSVGTEGVIRSAEERMYTVSADLVRLSDGAVVKSTREEIVYVLRGPFTRLFVKVLLYFVDKLVNTRDAGMLNRIHMMIAYIDNNMEFDIECIGLWEM